MPGDSRRRAAAGAVVIVAGALAACGSPAPKAAGSSTTTTTATTTTAMTSANTSTSASTTTSTRPKTTTTKRATPGQWTTYGYDNSRSADQPDSPSLEALHHLWTSPALDGAVYGEPLIWDGRVYAATENDTVYALDAASGTIEWSTHLATPAPSGDLPCGDIAPTVGITSAMVIDPARKLLFASGETLTGAGAGGVGHELWALDPASGARQWSRDLGAAGPQGATQLQRAALTLDAGRVLAGFGGNWGDCGSYHGWVVGVPESGSGATIAYQVPTQNQGAVWAPAGLSVNGAGDVFLGTGNGSATGGEPFDHGDAVIELGPDLGELQYFAPTDWAADNADDGDLGSTAPILLPGGYAFEVGKEVEGYLLDQSRLGGVGGEAAEATVCFAMGGDAWLKPYIYVGCPQNGVKAVRLGPGASIQVAWTTPSGAGGPPTIAGGLVWSVDAGTGTLDGLDPATGSDVVSVPIIATEHFAAPSAGDGLLVVGGAGAVETFAGPEGYTG
jgi:polyvinyl alcohol dehydrogenase (cytochrome)